jgi:hypothetical protein
LTLWIGLAPEAARSRRAAHDFARLLVPELRARFDIAKATLTAAYERSAERPTAAIHYTLTPTGTAFDAFKALAVIAESGWYGGTDDGWRCDRFWHRRYADEVFLEPGVEAAAIGLRAWSSLECRPTVRPPRRGAQASPRGGAPRLDGRDADT